MATQNTFLHFGPLTPAKAPSAVPAPVAASEIATVLVAAPALRSPRQGSTGGNENLDLLQMLIQNWI